MDKCKCNFCHNCNKKNKICFIHKGQDKKQCLCIKRVETILVKPFNELFDSLDQLCFLSKNLYNFINYILRQFYFGKLECIEQDEYKILSEAKKLPKEYDLTKAFAKNNQVDYRALPAQTSQQIIKMCYRNWKSYFKALQEFKKNPSKFKGVPKIPKYKHKEKGRNIIIFTRQQLEIKNYYLIFPCGNKVDESTVSLLERLNLTGIKTTINYKQLDEVRIVPFGNSYKIEIVYRKKIKNNNKLKFDNWICIDINTNNLAFVSNKIKPFLVNLREVKAHNQYYNKTKKRLQSQLPKNKFYSKRLEFLDLNRNNWMDNAIHQISSHITKFLQKELIGTVIIGKNKNQKQNINIGKQNNQNFVQIPFAKFINILKYKLKASGINVIETEESYTSKTDNLAKEDFNTPEDQRVGKRKKRGLFQSSVGTVIHADINGAIGIARKVFGDSVVKQIIDSGVGCTPVVKNVVQTILN